MEAFKSVQLLTLARDMGHVEAANGGYGKGMELVGSFYNQDIYVEKDRKQAAFWLRKAMESAGPDAVEEARKKLER